MERDICERCHDQIVGPQLKAAIRTQQQAQLRHRTARYKRL
jgi:hypothetical protein